MYSIRTEIYMAAPTSDWQEGVFLASKSGEYFVQASLFSYDQDENEVEAYVWVQVDLATWLNTRENPQAGTYVVGTLLGQEVDVWDGGPEEGFYVDPFGDLSAMDIREAARAT